MPSRRLLGSSTLRNAALGPYICPKCRFQANVQRDATVKQSRKLHSPRNGLNHQPRSIYAQGARPRSKQLRSPSHIGQTISRRSASHDTLVSRTAVNASVSVPTELRELHQSLLWLQDRATSYVDVSCLQLLLRSLESHDPVTRVAFLGLGASGLQAARRLARALLSDALGSEEEWEKRLTLGNDDRGIVLRYGDTSYDNGVLSGTSLLQTVNIPSLFLQKYKLEILIAPLNGYRNTPSDAESVQELEESILVPPITIPTSAGGRVGFVRYPVHNALIVAEGINGAVEYGRFPGSLFDGHLINSALSIPLRSSTGVKSTEVAVSGNAIDIELANHALDIFRESNANGAIFGEEWQTSRVGAIANWLSGSSTPASSTTALKPAVEALVLSLLDRTDNAVITAESSQSTAAASSSVPEARRAALKTALAGWAEEAHRDLQVNLATALDSPIWRRTVWWRLFWRIDDVSLSAAHVLRHGWLVEAEQSLAFLSGRMLEAGVAQAHELKAEPIAVLSETPSTTHPPPDAVAPAKGRALLDPVMANEVAEYKSRLGPRAENVAELMQLPPMLARVRAESGLDALFDPPWPRTLTLARAHMLHRHVPALHRAAQGLLVRALTTGGGASALAAWLWAASAGSAIYEAGAVAAFGLVWALRGLQRKWSALRQAFADTAREDGRRVLADVEARLARAIREGGRVEVREEDRRAWTRAREAVAVSRAAFERVGRR